MPWFVCLSGCLSDLRSRSITKVFNNNSNREPWVLLSAQEVLHIKLLYKIGLDLLNMQYERFVLVSDTVQSKEYSISIHFTYCFRETLQYLFLVEVKIS